MQLFFCNEAVLFNEVLISSVNEVILFYQALFFDEATLLVTFYFIMLFFLLKLFLK